jgi:hypothetical protein
MGSPSIGPNPSWRFGDANDGDAPSGLVGEFIGAEKHAENNRHNRDAQGIRFRLMQLTGLDGQLIEVMRDQIEWIMNPVRGECLPNAHSIIHFHPVIRFAFKRL